MGHKIFYVKCMYEKFQYENTQTYILSGHWSVANDERI